ncbi:MAG TPA: M20/M25/M40 family metallo-hydrolase [Candidatus Angelobacter sp.]|nr:M20/M25/M40 family metallo-hydrolase [Candidatus Angelobacter sp.]
MSIRLLRFVVTFFLMAVLQDGHAQTSAPAKQSAQSSPSMIEVLREIVETPAVTGYEQSVSKMIAARVKALPQHYEVKIDNLSNVLVTVGSGSPNRLIVAPIDEPGFVVSGITPDGYLTLQRLPQGGNLPLFNELYAAQPVKLQTPKGEWINGAIAGVSIHLQPQRQHPPSMADLDNMYVDVGATSAEQARTGGADVLSPLAIERKLYALNSGKQYASPAIGDRFGAAALLEILRTMDLAKLKGKLTVAFVTQQWLGARGLQKVLYQLNPEELIYVGRLQRAPAPPPAAVSTQAQQRETPGFKQSTGSGVLIATEKPEGELTGLAGELKGIADQNKISMASDFSGPLLPRGGYMAQAKLPERTVHLSIATEWPSTPAELIDAGDLNSLVTLLEDYLAGSAQKPVVSTANPTGPAAPARPTTAPSVETILKQLIETYGVSGGHEQNMREAVSALLPAWAKPVTDDAGNLILHWAGSAANKAPRIAVVAHMDEIGYEVHAVLPDGRLELETKGGGVLAYFLGHAALVHSGNGDHPGVLELPEGWEKPGFEWPRGPRMMFHMDIGAHNPEEVVAIGIKTGDFVTIPKQYHKLMGRRASARAFDDRVGCTALVAATWALGQNLKGRDITFIWSTSEELGLEGAAAAAKHMAADGKTPDYVFAVDTFVSADSPLESKRFGDAILGQGFVVRAADNSNIVPRDLAARVVSMARAGAIPAQYGVTGGGNDGAAFLLYGATDVAMGWPLRYSHSPGEVVDVRDVEALAKILTAIAQGW